MYSYKAKVVRVVDGDTVICDIDLGFNVHIIESIRLAAIDAPETGTPYGARSTARLRELLPTGQAVRLDVTGMDTYKRGVSQVYLLDAKGKQAVVSSCSAIMLAEGYAVPYEGK